MWIKDNEMVLQRPAVGMYPTQQEVDERVFDSEMNRNFLQI